ncbi:hypothetical protein FBY10_115119 [Pseudomonas sp. SJZ103]|nr:hypothetical protein [Pseudomonas sp. SJZ073]MBB6315619.1 hypothetical protein [Pseudomonas sp. JAI120]TWC63098.1 hypothetical protein FBY10_115119 [Pseudomonas sp. SJZ103]TWC80213.1 hypothetical protein FBY08_11659 [Pseudomonas sp. SJZ094]
MRSLLVILRDADSQGFSLDWTQRRGQQGLPLLFSALGLARETLHQEAPELARTRRASPPWCVPRSWRPSAC